MGVFSITCTSSLFAYLWLFYVLMDQVVSPLEAWLTFIYFFILIVLAYMADSYKRKQSEKLIDGDDNKPTIEFEAVEIYRELICEAKGEASKHEKDVRKREEMKTFLKATMNTD